MIIRPRRNKNKRPKKNSKNYRNIQETNIEDFLNPPKPLKKLKKRFDEFKPSFGEGLIIDWLNKKEIKFIREKKFRDLKNPATDMHLRFDFYLPDKKMCIEFDGKQHFEHVRKFDGDDKSHLIKRQFKDGIKDSFCQHRNFLMLRIRYDEIKQINEILDRCIGS